MSQTKDNLGKGDVQITQEKRKEAEERLKKLVPDMDPNQVMKMMYNNIKKSKQKNSKKLNKKFQQGDSSASQEERQQRVSKRSRNSSSSLMKEKKIHKKEKEQLFIGRFKHKTPSTAKMQNQPLQGMEVSARAKLDSFKRKIEIEELSQEEVYTEEEEQDPQEKKILQSITDKVEHHLKSHGDPLTLNERQIYSYLMQKQKQYHKGRNFKKWSIRMRRQYLQFVTFNDEIKKYYLDKIGRQEITYDEIQKYNKECRFEGMMKYLPRKLRHIINGRYKRDHKEQFQEINDKKKILGIKGEGAQRPQGQYEYEEQGLDPDFLKRYFSIFAPHNRFLYATALKTQKRAYTTHMQKKVRNPNFIIKSDEDIRNLNQIKIAVKILIVKGYSTKGMRAYMQQNNMKRDQYHKFMMAVVRISFRMLQKFMREKVDKALMYLHHKIVLMMCTPLLNIKFYFSKEQGHTAMKLWRLVFDVQDFKDKLTKSELINLYYACRRRQYERQVERVTPRDVRYLTQSYQNQHNQRMHLRKIKYFKYLDSSTSNEWGSSEGIYGVQQIFVDQVIRDDDVSRFTYEFQLQVLKLYLRVRKYQQVRKTLLDRVNQIQKYRNKYDMDMLRKVCDKLFRRIIKYMQHEFITSCKIFQINDVTYSEKKFLTMSACEKEILISRDDENDAKFLIFDYYLNNAYKKNKTARSHWEYAKMYLQYTIQAVCDFFQTKRHLKSIKMGTPEEQNRKYPLSSVYNEHYLNQRERLMYQNHYHKKISSVFGDGPREIVNCIDDKDTKYSSSYIESKSLASLTASNNYKPGPNSDSQSQRFNQISLTQIKPVIRVLQLGEIKVFNDRLAQAHAQIDVAKHSVDQISKFSPSDKFFCMIARMSKNMMNNYASFLYFHRKRETSDISQKYYDDGLTPEQKFEEEKKRYNSVKNSLTPEILSYIVKKQQRYKKEKGIDGEDEGDEDSRSVGKREVSSQRGIKHNGSDDEECVSQKVQQEDCQDDDQEQEFEDDDQDEDDE